MAGEVNTFTLTGDSVLPNSKTHAMDVGAETVSLKHDECSVKGDDDVAQAVDKGAETVPLKKAEASVEVNDVATAAGEGGESSVQVVAGKKKRGRKSKAEKEEALQKVLADRANKSDVVAGASSTVVVRKSTRSKKSKNMSVVVVEENEEKGKRGRKRQIISTSEAPQEGESGGVVKKKGRPGRKKKTAEKELVCGKPESDVFGAQDQNHRESEMPIVENKDYRLRNHRDGKPIVNKHDAKVT